MQSRKLLLLLFVLLILGYVLLPKVGTHQSAIPRGTQVEVKVPLGLPAVAFPADNPATVETIALGRKLYYDPALSADSTIACASCHDPAKGFADNKQFSEGVQGKKGTRNSPTVLNSAYYSTQFWDGRAPTLEKQAEGPVQNPLEMAHTLPGVESRLQKDPIYRIAFERAFGPGPITYEKVEKAIASFERIALSGNSPFDRYYFGHDPKAMSPAAIRGFQVFSSSDKGNCTACHKIEKDYALFTDNSFHNIGVGVDMGQISDQGRYEVTKQDKDRGAFRTPSLRNVSRTGPYMHDGSLKTLKEVVDYYIGAGNSNPYLDKQIRVLDFLSGQERADLEVFLEALTGEDPPDAGPPPKETLTSRR